MAHVIQANTIGCAWLGAMKHLRLVSQHTTQNILVEIIEPLNLPKTDTALINAYDQLLHNSGTDSSVTVANTIFPYSTYRAHRENFYRHYNEKVYPRIKTSWGTYFHRMTNRYHRNEFINPLQELVEKLRRESMRAGGMKSVFELSVSEPGLDIPTYDAARDCSYIRGGPCLSHISFKISASGHICLTAIYRYHYYAVKALGNFIGLAQLLNFVSTESGIPAGNLTCISTYATLGLPSSFSMNSLDIFLDEANASSSKYRELSFKTSTLEPV